jgi:hypothetical protein
MNILPRHPVVAGGQQLPQFITVNTSQTPGLRDKKLYRIDRSTAVFRRTLHFRNMSFRTRQLTSESGVSRSSADPATPAIAHARVLGELAGDRP